MKISASLMCANPLEIMRNVTSLIKLGVDHFHFDIMDGNFVNNLALNLNMLKQIRPLTRIPFDVHLMVQKPSLYFDDLIAYGADIVLFHVETAEDVLQNITYLKSKGVKVGLALHLDTHPEALLEYLPLIDYVLLMSVKTGYSGLPFNEAIIDKARYLYAHITAKKYPVQIFADGGIKLTHVKALYESGTDIVVAGTSMLFNSNGFSNNLDAFQKECAQLPPRKVFPLQTNKSQLEYQAAVLHGVNSFEVMKKTLTPLKENEVAVKVMSCGICGSDLTRVYKKGMYAKDLVPGHEFAGIVVRTSEKDKDLLNQRAAVFPLIACRNCEYCKAGKFNLCENYNYLGSRTNGGFAELVTVPRENLVPLPPGVSYEKAALIEPLAVALHGVKKIPRLSEANVIVLGLGPIGILAGMVAKKLGALSVTGIDRNEHKRVIAQKTGFDLCMDACEGKNWNVLIDCSGSSALLDSGIGALRKESVVLVLANHEEGLTLSPKSMASLVRGELQIIGSWNSSHGTGTISDWKACVDYLSREEIDVTPLITHTFPLKDIVNVFNMIQNKQLKSVKVLITPT